MCLCFRFSMLDGIVTAALVLGPARFFSYSEFQRTREFGLAHSTSSSISEC
jgi:hypothetical protein